MRKLWRFWITEEEFEKRVEIAARSYADALYNLLAPGIRRVVHEELQRFNKDLSTEVQALSILNESVKKVLTTHHATFELPMDEVYKEILLPIKPLLRGYSYDNTR